MAHWLIKSEPASYSWDDLVNDGGTEWNGVRNHTAAANLRAMAVGDTAFFYHSMTDKAIVGRVRVTRVAQPDGDDARWVSVRVEPLEPLARAVTLKEIKADETLAEMELVRQSRLSVAPVRADEWRRIEALAKQPA